MSESPYHPKRAAYQGLGRIGLLVHPGGDLITSDWNEIATRIEEHRPIVKCLVMWGDGTLSIRQLSLFVEIQKISDLPIVMFTDSSMTRGLMKLKQWFSIKHQVFSKRSLENGLKSLGLTRNELQTVKKTIQEMERMIDWSIRSSSRISLKPIEPHDPSYPKSEKLR
jgi:hypothetical protein